MQNPMIHRRKEFWRSKKRKRETKKLLGSIKRERERKELSRIFVLANGLPEEIMREILSRLPPESLLRFKSVNKSWYHLIKNPNFAAQHLVNSNSNSNSDSISILLKLPNRDALFFITYHQNNNTADVVVPDIHLPRSLRFNSPRLEIHGHCHGIICLSEFRYRGIMFLCNPTTREFLQLPPSSMPALSYVPHPYTYSMFYSAVGFGYDPNSGDFKVVRIMNSRAMGTVLPTRVEVYDLSLHRWRKLKNHGLDHLDNTAYQIQNTRYQIKNTPFEIYHNGFCYWRTREHGKEIILSFDMSEEVFSRISEPGKLGEYGRGYSSTMGIWKGSFVMIYFSIAGDEKTFDIWAMEKDGYGGVSWSKLLTIGPLLAKNPLMFLNSDVLLMESVDGKAISYNVNTQKFERIPMNGRLKEFQSFVFTKSLLPLKRWRKCDLEAAFL